MARILIVTGEASGDLHGASLARALRALRPDIEVLGMGGSHMQAAGVRMVRGIERHDVVGLIGLGQLLAVLRSYVALSRWLRKTQLDGVVFIDYPGFNLRMARVAARAGHRVLYYISPQIWAWRPGRIRQIARVVHRMIVILPFEAELYEKAGVPCSFVGHPLLDAVAPTYDRDELRKRYQVNGATPVVGLLPGSRASEVRTLLPLMLGAAAQLRAVFPDARYLLAQAASVDDDLIADLLKEASLNVHVVKEQSSEVLAACDLAWIASGTATLQSAVIGTPMILTYRASWLTAAIARAVIRIPWIGLVNIVAGRTLVPELLQENATAERLYEEARRLLTDRQAYETMRAGLQAVRASLGESGASRRAAEVIIAECRA